MRNEKQDAVLSLQAPAKINLYLKVLNKRPDGYHNLNSLFQMVGLYDQLTFRERPEGIGLQVRNIPLPADASNLVLRAATLLQEEMASEGRPPQGVTITLEKKIPVAAGLGGGSSDAVATLLGLNQLWSLDWPRERLAELSARLGSDLPFFFYGPTAWISGRGEQVEAIEPCYSGWIVLLHPEIAVSTASVYAQFDKKIGLTKARQPPKITALDTERPMLKDLLDHPYNDLEQVTLGTYPQLKELKTKLSELGGEGVLMSGSGPSIFGLFTDLQKANTAAETLEKSEKIKTFVAPILTQSPK